LISIGVDISFPVDFCSNYDNEFLPICPSACEHKKMTFYQVDTVWIPGSIVRPFTNLLPVLNDLGTEFFCNNTNTGFDCLEYAKSGAVVQCLNVYPWYELDLFENYNCVSHHWCQCGYYSIQKIFYASFIAFNQTVAGAQLTEFFLPIQDSRYIQVCSQDRFGLPKIANYAPYYDYHLYYDFDQMEKKRGIIIPVEYINDQQTISCNYVRLSDNEVIIRIFRQEATISVIILQFGGNFDSHAFNTTTFTYQLPEQASILGTSFQASVLIGTELVSTCIVDVAPSGSCQTTSWYNSSWSCMSVTFKALYCMAYIILGLAGLVLLICLAGFLWTVITFFYDCLRPSNISQVPVVHNSKSLLVTIFSFFCKPARAEDGLDITITIFTIIGVGIVFVIMIITLYSLMTERNILNKKKKKIIVIEPGSLLESAVESNAIEFEGNLSEGNDSEPELTLTEVKSGFSMNPFRHCGKRSKKTLNKEVFTSLNISNNIKQNSQLCIHNYTSCILCRKCNNHKFYNCNKCSSFLPYLMAIFFIPSILCCNVVSVLSNNNNVCVQSDPYTYDCNVQTTLLATFDNVLSSVCLTDTKNDFQIQVQLDFIAYELPYELYYYSSVLSYHFQNGQDCDAGTGVAQCASFTSNNCDPANSPMSFNFVDYDLSNCYCASFFQANDCILTYSKIFGAVNPVIGEPYTVFVADYASPAYKLTVQLTDSDGVKNCSTILSSRNGYVSQDCGILISKQQVSRMQIVPLYFVAYNYPDYTASEFFPSLLTNVKGEATNCGTGVIQSYSVVIATGGPTLISYYQNSCNSPQVSSLNSSNPGIDWTCCTGQPITGTFPFQTPIGSVIAYSMNQDGSNPILLASASSIESNIAFDFQLTTNFSYSISTQSVVPVSALKTYNSSGCALCQSGASFVGKFYSIGFAGPAAISCKKVIITNRVVYLTLVSQDFTINFQSNDKNVNDVCMIATVDGTSSFTLTGSLTDPIPIQLGNLTQEFKYTPVDFSHQSFKEQSVFEKIVFILVLCVAFIVLFIVIAFLSYFLYMICLGVAKKLV